MRFATPLTETLSVVNAGVTYTATYYKTPTLMTGVTAEIYANYNPLTPYAVGDYCIVPELKRKYKCAVASTGVFPPSSLGIKWIDFGPINSHKMFAIDENIGDATLGTDIYMEMPFNQIDTIGMIDTSFLSLHMQQIDNSTSAVLNDFTISGRDIGCLSLTEYFFTPFTDKTRVIIDNLDWHPNSTLKLTFVGSISIGNLVVGNAEELGITLYGTNLSFEDRSKIADNSVTEIRTVIRYGHVRVLSAKVMFDVAEFNLTAQKITRIIGKNQLFIPTSKDTFNEMNNIAYIEKFNLPVNNPKAIDTEIILVGVVKK